MTLKNLKINEQIHAQLVLRAQRFGMKITRLAEAILELGLQQSDSELMQKMMDEYNRAAARQDATSPKRKKT